MTHYLHFPGWCASSALIDDLATLWTTVEGASAFQIQISELRCRSYLQTDWTWSCVLLRLWRYYYPHLLLLWQLDCAERQRSCSALCCSEEVHCRCFPPSRALHHFWKDLSTGASLHAPNLKQKLQHLWTCYFSTEMLLLLQQILARCCQLWKLSIVSWTKQRHQVTR